MYIFIFSLFYFLKEQRHTGIRGQSFKGTGGERKHVTCAPHAAAVQLQATGGVVTPAVHVTTTWSREPSMHELTFIKGCVSETRVCVRPRARVCMCLCMCVCMCVCVTDVCSSAKCFTYSEEEEEE